MSTVATSLKLPARLKRRVDAIARKAGISPHAFMLQAIETELDAAERYRRFVDDALAAEREMQESGRGIALADARAYFDALAQGKPATRPRAGAWRK
jgi:predicted transcriptional regulator